MNKAPIWFTCLKKVNKYIKIYYMIHAYNSGQGVRDKAKSFPESVAYET